MLHSYPWYITNWRESEAVLRMTSEQRGIYRDLLDICWREGSLPTDERALRKIGMAEPDEWERSWPVIKAEFEERDGRLWNRKVDAKRTEVIKAKDDRRKGGEVRAEKAARVGGRFARAGDQQDSQHERQHSTSSAGDTGGSSTPAQHQPPTSMNTSITSANALVNARARTEPTSAPTPRTEAWTTDETYQPFVEAYTEGGACPGGKSLTPADWADAHFMWRHLDFEQKLAAADGIRRLVIAGQEPQFYPKPRRFIERKEWTAVVALRPAATAGLDARKAREKELFRHAMQRKAEGLG